MDELAEVARNALDKFGIDINDPNQTVRIYPDPKRADKYYTLAERCTLFVLVLLGIILTQTGMIGAPFIAGVVIIAFLMMTILLIARFSDRPQVDNPLIEVSPEGITISSTTTDQYSLIRWNKIQEAKKFESVIITNFGVEIVPKDEGTLYALAASDATRQKLDMRERMPQARYEFPAILVRAMHLPIPAESLVILINTRKDLDRNEGRQTLLEIKDEKPQPPKEYKPHIPKFD